MSTNNPGSYIIGNITYNSTQIVNNRGTTTNPGGIFFYDTASGSINTPIVQINKYGDITGNNIVTSSVIKLNYSTIPSFTANQIGYNSSYTVSFSTLNAWNVTTLAGSPRSNDSYVQINTGGVWLLTANLNITGAVLTAGNNYTSVMSITTGNTNSAGNPNGSTENKASIDQTFVTSFGQPSGQGLLSMNISKICNINTNYYVALHAYIASGTVMNTSFLSITRIG